MPFHVTIATDADSWFNDYLPRLGAYLTAKGHSVTVVHRASDIREGEIALLLSLGQIVSGEVLQRNRHNIVVHASELPHGKGWSPVTWQILEGRTSIPLTLLEAVDKVDAGPIYLRGMIEMDGTELVDEIRAKQAEATIGLCKEFLENYPEVIERGKEQSRLGESFYPRRGPEDSRLDPDKTLAEQFDLLRSCDPDRYPAFLDFRGRRFLVTLEPAPEHRTDGDVLAGE